MNRLSLSARRKKKTEGNSVPYTVEELEDIQDILDNAKPGQFSFTKEATEKADAFFENRRKELEAEQVTN